MQRASQATVPSVHCRGRRMLLRSRVTGPDGGAGGSGADSVADVDEAGLEGTPGEESPAGDGGSPG
jgi:hypothetical protein